MEPVSDEGGGTAARGDAGDQKVSAWTRASQHPAEHEQSGSIILEPGSDEGGGTAARGDAGDPELSTQTGASQHPAVHEQSGSIVPEPESAKEAAQLDEETLEIRQ